MAKNVVVCLDGTGNEFGLNNSNVVKLYQVLQNDGTQVAYYHPGLGTMGAPGAWSKIAAWWTKTLGQAIGFGLPDTVGDAYRFLMDNFEEGDRVYIFGFSRGAYMARALAALLFMFGLASRGNYAVIPYMVRMLSQKDRSKFAIAPHFKATFSRPCIPHFIGVWDTVKSVGWLYNPIKIPYTANNPDTHVGRHVVSLDERRALFPTNLWQGEPGQDIVQVWFAGVHSDVGGGYAESESGLAKITLKWMLDEATRFELQVNEAKRDEILGSSTGSGHYVPPDPCAKIHESLVGFWHLIAVIPRIVRVKIQTSAGYKYHRKVFFGAGHSRHVDEGSLIHASVLARQKCPNLDYKPKNLPQVYSVVP